MHDLTERKPLFEDEKKRLNETIHNFLKQELKHYGLHLD